MIHDLCRLIAGRRNPTASAPRAISENRSSRTQDEQDVNTHTVASADLIARLPSSHGAATDAASRSHVVAPAISSVERVGRARGGIYFDDQGLGLLVGLLRQTVDLGLSVSAAHAAFAGNHGAEDSTNDGPVTGQSRSQWAITRSASGQHMALQKILIAGDVVAQASRNSAAESDQAFHDKFRAAHVGSVAAIARVVHRLRERSAAQVPLNGITRAHIEERHWDITYKLPALMLVQQLPELCEKGGVLGTAALFDTAWQKQEPNKAHHYDSLLPKLYRYLLATYNHKPLKLAEALPTLTARISYLIETGQSGNGEIEKPLVGLIHDAVHRIDGRVLYTALGEAYAQLSAH